MQISPLASATAPVDAAETATGAIFLVGDRAFKGKKPVDLGVVDLRGVGARRAACEREIELNSRLAPDVYLGIADVLGPDGSPYDHLVVMRRMPAGSSLSALVSAGVPADRQVRELAEAIAAFHATAARGPSIAGEGGRDGLRRRWGAGFAEMSRFVGTLVERALAEFIEERASTYLAGRAALFDERVATERIVDGHGDLTAGDIYLLDDGPRILDCAEFDDRLRWLDGLDDAAGLAVDLEYLGAPALAEWFLDRYTAYTADPAPASLRHHYRAYRAFVQVRAASRRHAAGDPAAAVAAGRYATLAAHHLHAGTVRLFLVDALDHAADHSVDRAVDHAAASGRPAGVPLGGAPVETLLARASTLLGRGESVVVEGAWHVDRHRALARAVADRTASRLVTLPGHAPNGTLDETPDQVPRPAWPLGWDGGPPPRQRGTEPGS